MTGILRRLSEEGVSLWLDGLGRDRLADGRLAELAGDRSVVGVVATPSAGPAYHRQLAELAARGASAAVALRELTVRDLHGVCTLLDPIHRCTAGSDGLVSAAVDPAFARGTLAALAEARALYRAVDRPNLLVELPATVEALPAVTRCLAEGIGVHVSLVLSPERYGQVLEAFLTGLELAAEQGRDVSRINSVAAVPVGLLDAVVDHALDAIGTEEARAFRGQAGPALARLAYRRYEAEFASPRWTALAALGARPQRLLWSHTGTDGGPGRRDTRYVDELVAPNTVTAVTERTLAAVAEHGRPARAQRFAAGYADAERVLGYLEWFGLELAELLDGLERESLAGLRRTRTELLESVLARLTEVRESELQDAGAPPAGH
ncbi:transaldolase family protein [Kitasatospora sp. NPDC096147]|uniref:transaldolase family protein n=1 Tax=Kitasatospora sp. NPDC096147 TaxID=3364093 RepID=UPI0037FD80D5